MNPTRTDLLNTLDEIHSKARVTVEKRNQAYAGAGDVFGNLNLIETLSNGRVSTEAGIVIRMADKISRLWSLIHEGAPESDEKLEDTLQDLLGYSGLLLLRHRTRARTPSCLNAPLATSTRAGRWASQLSVHTCPECMGTILPGQTCCRMGVEELKTDVPPKKQPALSAKTVLQMLCEPGAIKDNKITFPLPVRIDPGFGRHITLEARDRDLYVFRFDDSLTDPGMRDYVRVDGSIGQEALDSTVGNIYVKYIGLVLLEYLRTNAQKEQTQTQVPGELDPADGG